MGMHEYEKNAGGPAKTYVVEVGNMTTQTARGLTPSVLRLISEEHIARP